MFPIVIVLPKVSVLKKLSLLVHRADRPGRLHRRGFELRPHDHHQARHLRRAARVCRRRARSVLRLRLRGGRRSALPDGDGPARGARHGLRGDGADLSRARQGQPRELLARLYPRADGAPAGRRRGDLRRLCRGLQRAREGSAGRQGAADAQAVHRRGLRARPTGPATTSR